MLFVKHLFLLAAASFRLVSAQIPVTVREGTDDVDGIQAVLTPDTEKGMVHVEMTAERLGYLAFGFSLDTKMPATLVVVGLPDDGTVLKRDSEGYSDPVLSDGRQTLVDTSITQNATHTVMKFSKLIEEDGEPTVVLEGNNIFLYAIGSSNTFGYHGTDRGNFELDFAVGEAVVAEVKTYQGLWMTHGFMMALSWALLIPIGVGVSVFRSFIPGANGTWFMLHRALNGTGLVLMIIGFVIAVYIIQDSGVDHFSLEIPHRFTGLMISLFGFAQGLWGIFRPHAPHAPAPSADDKAGDTHVVVKTPARAAFEYGHRILGVALLAVAWYNTSIGLDLYSGRFGTRDLSLTMWVVVAILAAVTVGLGVKQRL